MIWPNEDGFAAQAQDCSARLVDHSVGHHDQLEQHRDDGHDGWRGDQVVSPSAEKDIVLYRDLSVTVTGRVPKGSTISPGRPPVHEIEITYEASWPNSQGPWTYTLDTFIDPYDYEGKAVFRTITYVGVNLPRTARLQVDSPTQAPTVTPVPTTPAPTSAPAASAAPTNTGICTAEGHHDAPGPHRQLHPSGRQAYDIFPIEDGLVTCGANDINSCPDGTDIWVPRSLDHAKAVWDLYGGVRGQQRLHQFHGHLPPRARLRLVHVVRDELGRDGLVLGRRLDERRRSGAVVRAPPRTPSPTATIRRTAGSTSGVGTTASALNSTAAVAVPALTGTCAAVTAPIRHPRSRRR